MKFLVDTNCNIIVNEEEYAYYQIYYGYNLYLIDNFHIVGDIEYKRSIIFNEGILTFIYGTPCNDSWFGYKENIIGQFDISLEYVNHKGHVGLFNLLNETFENNPEIGEAFRLLFELGDNDVLNVTDINYSQGSNEISMLIKGYEIVDDSNYILK